MHLLIFIFCVPWTVTTLVSKVFSCSRTSWLLFIVRIETNDPSVNSYHHLKWLLLTVIFCLYKKFLLSEQFMWVKFGQLSESCLSLLHVCSVTPALMLLSELGWRYVRKGGGRQKTTFFSSSQHQTSALSILRRVCLSTAVIVSPLTTLKYNQWSTCHFEASLVV